ncbi:hypothetical protein EOM33_03100 [Candidatus Saccharibacteria bacterium]|nr:hypothetical protein [Candidatus Saccharibacteria bacterium]
MTNMFEIDRTIIKVIDERKEPKGHNYFEAAAFYDLAKEHHPEWMTDLSTLTVTVGDEGTVLCYRVEACHFLPLHSIKQVYANRKREYPQKPTSGLIDEEG